MPKIKEIIKHAAVRSKCGNRIFLGKQHADCFYQADNIGVETSTYSADQGFVTSRGRYVNREEGARIAAAAGQIKNKKQTVLCSEDIWCPKYNGEWSYDSVTGYVKNEK